MRRLDKVVAQVCQRYGEEPENVRDHVDGSLTAGEQIEELERRYGLRPSLVVERFDLYTKPESILYLLCWYGIENERMARFMAMVEDDVVKKVIEAHEGMPVPQAFLSKYRLPPTSKNTPIITECVTRKKTFVGLRGKWARIKRENHKTPRAKYRNVRWL